MDEILLLGVNHRQAAIEMRERLAFSPDQIHRAMAELQSDQVEQEFVILSTCNRSEFYIRSQDICLSENRLKSYLA